MTRTGRQGIPVLGGVEAAVAAASAKETPSRWDTDTFIDARSLIHDKWSEVIRA